MRVSTYVISYPTYEVVNSSNTVLYSRTFKLSLNPKENEFYKSYPRGNCPMVLMIDLEESVSSHEDELLQLGDCYEYQLTCEEWLNWARETRKSGYQNVDEVICQFIEKNPQFLFVPANHINPDVYYQLSVKLTRLLDLDFHLNDKQKVVAFPHINDKRNIDIHALAAMLDKVDDQIWYRWVKGRGRKAYPERIIQSDLSDIEDAKYGTYRKYDEYCLNLAKTNRLKFFASCLDNEIFECRNASVSEGEVTKAWKTYIDECFTIK